MIERWVFGWLAGWLDGWMDGLAGKNIRIGSLFDWLFGDISVVYLGFYIVV